MIQRFGRETWSVVLPASWQGSHDRECASISATPEVGALQVSAAFKESEVTDEDLLEFAEEHTAAGRQPRPTRLGEFSGFEFAFEAESYWWRQWFLRSHEQMLYVTYICDSAARGAEDQAVDGILSTLSSSPGAPEPQ